MINQSNSMEKRRKCFIALGCWVYSYNRFELQPRQQTPNTKFTFKPPPDGAPTSIIQTSLFFFLISFFRSAYRKKKNSIYHIQLNLRVHSWDLRVRNYFDILFFSSNYVFLMHQIFHLFFFKYCYICPKYSFSNIILYNFFSSWNIS